MPTSHDAHRGMWRYEEAILRRASILNHNELTQQSNCGLGGRSEFGIAGSIVLGRGVDRWVTGKKDRASRDN